MCVHGRILCAFRRVNALVPSVKICSVRAWSVKNDVDVGDAGDSGVMAWWWCGVPAGPTAQPS